MRRRRLAVGMLLTLVGCSAVGVVESSDPRVKLDQAVELWEHQGRFTPAKRLISDALAIYQQRGDELGIAETYRTFAFYYRADTSKFGRSVLVPDDFVAPARYQLSMDYFRKALEIYERHGEDGMASNVYMSMGQSYAAIFNDKPEACRMFDLSLAANRNWMTVHPDAKVNLPRGISSFEELIARGKQEIPCT